MDKKEELEPLLPAEFAELEPDLREAQQQLDEIDTHMANLPKDKGLTPELTPHDFNPPGYQKPPPDKNAMIKQLEDRKTKIRTAFKEKLEDKIIKIDAGPKLSKNAREAAEINLSDSQYRKSDKAQFKEQKTDVKSPDLSEEYMNKVLSNYRASVQEKRGAEPEPEKTTDQKPFDPVEYSMGNLNYTKMLENTKDIAEVSPDKPDGPTVELGDMEPERD